MLDSMPLITRVFQYVSNFKSSTVKFVLSTGAALVAITTILANLATISSYLGLPNPSIVTPREPTSPVSTSKIPTSNLQGTSTYDPREIVDLSSQANITPASAAVQNSKGNLQSLIDGNQMSSWIAPRANHDADFTLTPSEQSLWSVSEVAFFQPAGDVSTFSEAVEISILYNGQSDWQSEPIALQLKKTREGQHFSIRKEGIKAMRFRLLPSNRRHEPGLSEVKLFGSVH